MSSGSHSKPKPRIGLVLGAGAARGWSHIGIIEALADRSIHPQIVCGCSSGAIVAASYATGRLAHLKELAESLTWLGVLGYMDFSFNHGGLIEGQHVIDFFAQNVEDTDIQHCAVPFGAVATDLYSGRETWLTSGSILDAVRASIALPGLLTPIRIDGRWLVDGSLTNPLPVALCGALGADIIIGVNLSGDLISHRGIAKSSDAGVDRDAQEQSSWLERVTGAIMGGRPNGGGPPSGADSQEDEPAYMEVIAKSLVIMQNFVTRVRVAANPVDIIISPDVSHIGLMDFHRGKESIQAGREAVEKMDDKLTLWQ